jgi:type IV secretion system protein TrbL
VTTTAATSPAPFRSLAAAATAAAAPTPLSPRRRRWLLAATTAAASSGPRRTRRRRSLLAAGALLAMLLAWPAAASAQPGANSGILDGLVRGYQDISASWLERIQPIAQRTFALLATLELAVSGLLWAIERTSLDAIAASLFRKVFALAFLFSLLTLFPLWIPAITAGFDAAGQAASATGAVNPSQILALGNSIAARMLLSFGSLGFLVNPVGVQLASFTALFVVLAFGLIAAQLCLTLVETYVVLTGGALFLGFAGFRVTAPLTEGYLAYAFQVGAKIYLLYLLIGVGTGLAQQWATLDFAPGFDFAPPSLASHFEVMCGSIIFCLLVWYIPRTVSARLVRGLSFHLAEALR